MECSIRPFFAPKLPINSLPAKLHPPGFVFFLERSRAAQQTDFPSGYRRMPITLERAEVPPKLEEIEKIFVAHHDRVYRAAYRVTGSASDAEDVVQTVFLRLIRNPRDFAVVDDAGNYLHRAGINAALDLVRSRKVAVPLDEGVATRSSSSGWIPDRQHDPAQLRGVVAAGRGSTAPHGRGDVYAAVFRRF